MTPTASPSGGAADEARDPLDLLSEQFLQRYRAGELIDVEAFCAQHREHAEGLRELLPTLLVLERAKRERESTASGRARAQVPMLERLGDFKIQGELGRGGMGVVFEAVQESLGRRVALKVLPRGSLLTGNQLERFRREAQTAAKLHHSNIVPVFGSGESDGYHWYAMQFIDGRGLDHWFDEARQQPALAGSAAFGERARFVAQTGAQVASALAHAHAHGTLHRDIKPANLLLDGEGLVWVTDFGLAKALESTGLTHSGDVLGTLQYMAPEQFAGVYDARSEVYALGLTLWELLTLRPAFGGSSRSEVIEQICRGRPDRLRRLCPWLPRDLETIVEKAIAHDPRDRFADAAALEADLQAFLDGRPIAARQQSLVEQAVRWCRRNQAVAALTLATAAAVVLAAVVGWTAWLVTADALGQARQAAADAREAHGKSERNVQLMTTAFEELFDAVVGRDPLHVIEEDPETGEASVVAGTTVEADDVALLQRMLHFYDRFAAQNADNQPLRYETARAWRRVGAIHARLGDMAAAEAAWQQASARFQDVADRDVTRDVAGIQLDQAQLLLRRDRFPEAVARLRPAIKLLEEDLADQSKGMKFDRARAHYLLASAYALQMRGPFSGRGDERRGGGRPEDRRADGGRGEPRRPAEVRSEIERAQEPLAELLVIDAQNPEFRALSARCLLLLAAGPGDDRDNLREQGLQLLRALVVEVPQADQYRYELCLELLRMQRSRRGPVPGGGGGDPQVLREALYHAEQLVTLQPAIAEYRVLRARAQAWCGESQLRQGGDAEGGEALLRAGLQQLDTLLARGRTDGRMAMDFAIGSMVLATRLFRTDRRAEAKQVASAMVARLQPLRDAARPLRGFANRAPAEFHDVLRELGVTWPDLGGGDEPGRRR
ncbi:MAG: serine/threonine protein kinase [Planctomycetes bacterium]|nr:serine/threonine protein kinase [Planctomycetota bacterium]